MKLSDIRSMTSYNSANLCNFLVSLVMIKKVIKIHHLPTCIIGSIVILSESGIDIAGKFVIVIVQ